MGKFPPLVRGSSNCRPRFLLLTLTNSQPALDQSGVFHLPNHALFNYLEATHSSEVKATVFWLITIQNRILMGNSGLGPAV